MIDDFDFDDDVTADTLRSVPPVLKRPTFIVEQRQVQLFLTAPWHVVVRVDDEVILKTDDSQTPMSSQHINALARGVIISRIHDLRNLNVDVTSAYRSFGGDPNDLLYL